MAGKVVDSLRRSLRLQSNTSGSRSSNGSSSFAGSSLWGEDDLEPEYEAFLDGPARAKTCVVAIDFGTTNSGFAYALTRDAKIHVVRKKEPTCALFRRKDKTLVEYGLRARNLFHKAQAAQELMSKMNASAGKPRWEDDFIYIDQDAKMWLFDNATATADLQDQVYPPSGGMLTYFEVVSGILEHIKDLSLDRVARDLQQLSGAAALAPLEPENVLWVLTVPSICGEAEKQFMRRAARAGGLIDDDFSGDLVVALESECAAVWAEAVFEMEQKRQAAALAASPALRRSRNRPQHTPLKSGETVLCLDCGGGTVDIAAVRVLQTRREGSDEMDISMDQLLPPVGLKVGAQDIDRKFQEFLRMFLGKRDFKEAWAQNESRAELQDGWEEIKLALKMDNFLPDDPEAPSPSLKARSASAVNVAAAGKLPALTLSVTLTELNARLPDLVKNFNKRMLAVGGRGPIQLSFKKARTRAASVLYLPPELLHFCFDDVVEQIISKTAWVMDTYMQEGVDHLILYGGLGNSVYLRHRVSERFRDRVDVRLAHQASLAVMKGAVKFGLFPRIINSRRARMTVGVKVSIPFVRGKHNRKPHMQHKAYDEQTREYIVRDVFRTFVTRGQLIEVDETYRHMFLPANKHKDSIKFDVFGSLASHVEYVTEPGCFKLARIVVPIKKGDMSKVTCALSFGHTEIRATILAEDGTVVREVPLLFDRVGEHAILSAVHDVAGRGDGDDGVTPRADKGGDADDADTTDHFALA